jgi:hypothetical protein
LESGKNWDIIYYKNKDKSIKEKNMKEKSLIIKFVIVLLLSIPFIVLGILLTIKDTYSYSYSSRFVEVLDEGSFEIIVDKNTKVMYLQSTKGEPYRGYGGLTVMVDAEGKPLLWKE